jgi:thiamine-phosphate diphosphorylase
VTSPPAARTSSPPTAVAGRVLPVIHAVTVDDIVAREDFISLAAGVMRVLGPRGAVHLRAADVGGHRLFDIAVELAAHQEPTGAWLVVNDRIDIALAAGAWAVQLTSRSLGVVEARHVVHAAAGQTTPLAIGASIHSLEDARAAAGAGADAPTDDGPAWLVVGHVFATPSHAGEPGRGMSLLRDICAAVSVPVIAIGGVQPGDMPPLLAAGAYGVAAIRGIWRAVDAEGAAADYLSAYDAVRDARAAGRGGSGDHC